MIRLFVVAWMGLLCCACTEAQDSTYADRDRANADRDPTLERGQILSLACQACHSLDAGGAHLVGPNLNGVFGRAAGTAAGFSAYSPALQNADFVWTPDRLDRWLYDPQGFLPGTSMAFTGFQSADDRAALIEFLLDATQSADD